MLLETLVAAGIGDRPVIFVTHRQDNMLTLGYARFLEFHCNAHWRIN